LRKHEIVPEAVRLRNRLHPRDEVGPASIDAGDTNSLQPLKDDHEVVLLQRDDLQHARGAPHRVELRVRTFVRRILLGDHRDELARPLRALDRGEASLPRDIDRKDGAGKEDAVAERQHRDLAHDLDALDLWSLAGQGVILTPLLKKLLRDEQQGRT